jgi:hypothetical protein
MDSFGQYYYFNLEKAKLSIAQQKPKVYSSGIGKYIKPEVKSAIRRVAIEKVPVF